jgi:hypothetical protein
VQRQSVSTGAYKPDGKVLIGVLLGATIKTISLEKEGETIEQGKRDRAALLVGESEERKGQGKTESCRHDEQEKILTNVKVLSQRKLTNKTC